MLATLAATTLAVIILTDLASTSTEDAPYEVHQQIDHVVRIEPFPTQLVVVTSKEGAVANMQVTIEVTDIEEEKTNPPFITQGLWLAVNRGRYTLPFLRPSRWYGITFKVTRGSESLIEYRLAKTLDRPPPGLPPGAAPEDTGELFDIHMHRGDENGGNVEGLFVTVRWKNYERPNKSELVVRLSVNCENSIAEEEVTLPHNQEGISVEIAMDHKYDMEDLNDTLHTVIAHITPLQCHQVCWKPALHLPAIGRSFSQEFPEQCHSIEGVTSTTFLRDFKYYTLHNGELVVETEHNPVDIDEGFVTLSALRLGHNMSEQVFYRSYSTLEQDDGVFGLPLDDAGYYAVRYEYNKVKPFHYASEERFLVESEGKNNSDKAVPLVDLTFEPSILPKKGEKQKIRFDEPTAFLARDIQYEGLDVDVTIEPFCGENETQIRLTDGYQHHELKLPIARALCAHNSEYAFCDNSTRAAACSPLLCYNAAVTLENVRYPLSTRCSNITHHFSVDEPPVPSATSLLRHLVLVTLILLYL